MKVLEVWWTATSNADKLCGTPICNVNTLIDYFPLKKDTNKANQTENVEF